MLLLRSTAQALVDKYESIRSRTVAVGRPLSEKQLYLELQLELFKVLDTTTSNGASVQRPGHLSYPVNATASTPEVPPVRPSWPSAHPSARMDMNSNTRRLVEPRIPEVQSTPRKMSILVVDDSHISCSIAMRTLGQQNFHCEVRMTLSTTDGPASTLILCYRYL